MKRYQGKILDKEELHRKFEEKIKRCETNPNMIVAKDWQNMRLILESLFKAFQ